MKKELTIEHLAAYLPYGVRCVYQTGNGMGEHSSVIESIDISRPFAFGTPLWPNNDIKRCKLLLRPLSQLTEVIEHNGERFVPIVAIIAMKAGWVDWLTDERDSWMAHYDTEGYFGRLPYKIIVYLHSLHFDTFGLIEAGLAEPIPSIEQP